MIKLFQIALKEFVPNGLSRRDIEVKILKKGK